MTSRFWGRFAPSMPRVIAVPGLAKGLDARQRGHQLLRPLGTGRRSGTSRPPSRQQQLVAPALREFV
jgi:hypothetical protein